MATITPVVTNPVRGISKVVWSNLTDADTALAERLPHMAEKAVQVDVTAGTPTCIIEGSNDNSTFTGLNDPSSAALSFAADGLNQILENPEFIRPRVSTGTGTVTVTIVAHANR